MTEAAPLILPAQAARLADFKSQLLAFPNARFDDQVEALLLLLLWVRCNNDGPISFGAPIVFHADYYGQMWESDIDGERPAVDCGGYHDHTDPWL